MRTMLLPTIVLLAASCLVSALAVVPSTQLTKRAYIPELKAALAHIDESWKKLEAQLDSLSPKTSTEADFRAAKSSIDTLNTYMQGDYQAIIRANGPFTNTKWSDAFIEDLKPYQANGRNAMRTLQTYVPRINATGGVPLLKDFYSTTGILNGAFAEMETFLARYTLQFVGGDALLKPIREYKMVPEIGNAVKIFYLTYCEIEWGHPCASW